MVEISNKAFVKKAKEQLNNVSQAYGLFTLSLMAITAVFCFLTYSISKNRAIIEIVNIFKYTAMVFGTISVFSGISAIYSKTAASKSENIAEYIDDISLIDENSKEVAPVLDITLTNSKGIDLKSELFGRISELSIHELKLVMEALKLEAEATYLEYDGEGKIIEESDIKKLTYENKTIN